eukprot:CAMPEP_0171457744 /NCGR_PEP_ID=MMETSP0945-20130129/3700_1 /TAXON_ID=109269 /ORGANISM="Vaucheria litorea, Strain CCMP2940" /LENGTH=671 /DNA_ID=CAMNT_0011983413 /DNA_START=277 /DNA_END=2292 /DNA_ORIENTATION=+
MVVRSRDIVSDMYYSESCGIFGAYLEGENVAFRGELSSIKKLEEFRSAEVELSSSSDNCPTGSDCFTGQSYVLIPIEGLSLYLNVEYSQPDSGKATINITATNSEDLEIITVQKVQECAELEEGYPSQTITMKVKDVNNDDINIYYKVEMLLPTRSDRTQIEKVPTQNWVNEGGDTCVGGGLPACTSIGAFCSTNSNCCSGNCFNNTCSVRLTDTNLNTATTFVNGIIMVPFFTVSNGDFSNVKRALSTAIGQDEAKVIFSDKIYWPGLSTFEAMPIQRVYTGINQWYKIVKIPFTIEFDKDVTSSLQILLRLSTDGISQLASDLGTDERSIFIDKISVSPTDDLKPEYEYLDINTPYSLRSFASTTLAAFPGYSRGQLPNHSYSIGVGWFVLFCVVAATIFSLIGFIWSFKKSKQPKPIANDEPILRRPNKTPVKDSPMVKNNFREGKTFPPLVVQYPEVDVVPPPIKAYSPVSWNYSPSSDSNSRPPSTSSLNPVIQSSNAGVDHLSRFRFSDREMLPKVTSASEGENEAKDAEVKYGKPVYRGKPVLTNTFETNSSKVSKISTRFLTSNTQSATSSEFFISPSSSSNEESPIAGLQHLRNMSSRNNSIDNRSVKLQSAGSSFESRAALFENKGKGQTINAAGIPPTQINPRTVSYGSDRGVDSSSEKR